MFNSLKEIKLMTIFIFTLIMHNSYGSVPSFNNISSTQIEGILKDFASNFFPSTGSPASNGVKDFGAEVSLSAGLSNAGNINSTVSESFSNLPKFGANIIVSLPKGFGLEAIGLSLNTEGLQYKFNSLGIGWTFTDIFKFPLDLKIKTQYSRGHIRFNQELSGNKISVQYENSSLIFGATISKKAFIIFEPFYSIGHIDSTNTLSSTGATSIFDVSVSTSSKSDVKLKDIYQTIGMRINAYMFNLSFEKTEVFNNSIYLAKIGMHY